MGFGSYLEVEVEVELEEEVWVEVEKSVLCMYV